jgi:hypothetical protein
METKKLTYLDVLNDTIEYYSVDTIKRRSVDSNTKCLYSFEGRNCAFGRYINNVDEFIEKNNEYNNESANILLETFGNEVLKDEVRHLNDYHFWLSLQELHDISSNWNKTGLTERGLSKVEQIKNYINQIN